MTDAAGSARDLVKRLRRNDSFGRYDGGIFHEAADRIEQLEAALAASPSEEAGCEHDSENGTFAWECMGCGRLRKDGTGAPASRGRIEKLEGEKVVWYYRGWSDGLEQADRDGGAVRLARPGENRDTIAQAIARREAVVEQVAEDHAYHDARVYTCPLCTDDPAERGRRMQDLVDAKRWSEVEASPSEEEILKTALSYTEHYDGPGGRGDDEWERGCYKALGRLRTAVHAYLAALRTTKEAP